MSWVVMLTQVFLPVLLLVWLARFPAAGWLAWGLSVDGRFLTRNDRIHVD